VEDLLADLDLTTVNDGQNTYLSKTTGTESAIDITAINHEMAPHTQWTILKNAISDHSPIVTTLYLTSDQIIQNKRSWNFRKANWNLYTETLEELCLKNPPNGNINERLHILTTNFNQAAKASIPRGKRRDNWVPYWTDRNIDSMIEERDNIRDQMKTDNTEENRRKLIEITHKVEQEICDCKREKWADFCSKLDPRKDHQHWNIIKILDNNNKENTSQPTNIITDAGRKAVTNKATANMLAEYYSNQTKLHMGR
jgi:hypothetical protein